MSGTKKDRIFTVYDIAFIGLLTALEFVFKSYLQISTPIVKIGFGFLPVAAAALRYRPYVPVFVAVAGDLMGYFFVNFGQSFCYGITITAALTGLCTGLFIHRKCTPVRIVSYVLINNVFGSLLMNSFWLHFQYGVAYSVLMPARAVQAAVMTAVECAVMITLTAKDDSFFSKFITKDFRTGRV